MTKNNIPFDLRGLIQLNSGYIQTVNRKRLWTHKGEIKFTQIQSKE